MAARKTDETLGTPLGLPRNLLVPYVLLYLKNLSAHGYQILQTLTLLGFAAVDPGTVYRSLRHMEAEGLVRSAWDTASAGPARRTYQITDEGEQFLARWAEALGAYQGFLNRFFELYAGGTKPPANGATTSEEARQQTVRPETGGADRSGRPDTEG